MTRKSLAASTPCDATGWTIRRRSSNLRGRPPRSALCVCCGLRSGQRIEFPRSSTRFGVRATQITICGECRKLVGKRRFLSVPSMRRFVRWHLRLRHQTLGLIDAELPKRIPRELLRCIAGLNRLATEMNRRTKRRLDFGVIASRTWYIHGSPTQSD